MNLEPEKGGGGSYLDSMQHKHQQRHETQGGKREKGRGRENSRLYIRTNRIIQQVKGAHVVSMCFQLVCLTLGPLGTLFLVALCKHDY